MATKRRYVNMENKPPSRLCVRKNDLDDFKVLLQEKDSPFYKKDNKSVFLMAMILGFHNKQSLPLDKKEEFVRMEYFSQDDKSLMKAIAIKSSEKGLKILLNQQEIYSIAEQYAAGGIGYLKSAVFDSKYGSYVKRLEADLIDAFDKLKR
jgi:hypothetical protein